MLKWLKWLSIAVVVLIIGGLLAAWLGLNALVRKSVEAAATSGLQTKTTLGSASVSPFGGSVTLSDLSIASPDGFKSPQMFMLGRVGVSSGIGQLFGKPVTINDVMVTGPQLVVEQNGGKLNVLSLSEKLRGDGTAKPADPNAQTMKLVIGRLEITDASVTIIPGLPGLEREYSVKLPPITLQNIGNADGNQNGEELSRVLNTIVATLAAKAAKSDQVPESVRQLMTLDVKQVSEKLQGRAKDELKKVTDRLDSKLGNLLDKAKK